MSYFDQKLSREGVMISDDGVLIYDDSWLHQDILEQNNKQQMMRNDKRSITNIDAIVDTWGKSKRVVIFTGAGMSTESGLPDFRSASGLWKSRPESLASLNALKNQPDEFYFFYQWRIARLWEATPNLGHSALKSLQTTGFIHRVITQNVDGFHQRAGSDNVTELHGSLRTVSCTRCNAQFDSKRLIPVDPNWENNYNEGKYNYGKECYCEHCKGLLRPDVILFGEQLPEQAWIDAVKWSKAADLIVVLGSSLTVSPANLCPQWAIENGAKLLIINNEATALDTKATWVIRGGIGSAVQAIKERLL